MSRRQHKTAREAINNAGAFLANRYRSSIKNNSNLTNRDIKQYLALSDPVRQLFTTAAERLGHSARSYFKIIKVARIIADPDAGTTITAQHVSEVLQYRQST